MHQQFGIWDEFCRTSSNCRCAHVQLERARNIPLFMTWGNCQRQLKTVFYPFYHSKAVKKARRLSEVGFWCLRITVTLVVFYFGAKIYCCGVFLGRNTFCWWLPIVWVAKYCCKLVRKTKGLRMLRCLFDGWLRRIFYLDVKLAAFWWPKYERTASYTSPEQPSR